MIKDKLNWILKSKIRMVLLTVSIIGIGICVAMFPLGRFRIAVQGIYAITFILFLSLAIQEWKFNQDKTCINLSLDTWKFTNIFVILFKTIIFSSIIIRIIAYTRESSLWYDEAALVESIIVRDISNLVVSPLANSQTAPVFYLYTVKLLGLLFGYSESVLRFYSFVVFIGMLLVEWALLKKAFKVESLFVWAALCITSTLSIYMNYSHELKPYMGDAFFAVLILYLYHLYGTTKINTALFTLCCCLSLLFSSPAIFFSASVGIVECISAIRSKNKKYFFNILCFGLTISAVFLGNYVLWLRPVTEDSTMVNFWKFHRFHILPLSIKQLLTDARLIYSVLKVKSSLFITACYTLLAIAGLIISIYRKNRISLAVGTSLFLLLVASNFEKYPIVDRLNLFVYVIFIMYMSICLDIAKSVTINIKSSITGRLILNIKTKWIGLLVIFLFILINTSYILFAYDGLYKDTHEANQLIKYVRLNIKDDESLYVYPLSKHVFRYKNGYDSNRIGNVAHDNIIWGRGGFYWSKNNQDDMSEFQIIAESKKCYLLFSHLWEEEGWRDNRDGLEKLKQFGDVREVMVFQGTPLYYFTVRQAR
jgi:hypothetical protein